MRFLILFICFGIQFPSLETVRENYANSIESESAAESLYKSLEDADSKTPIFLAYKGAVRAVMAKHAFLPNTKYSCAKEGVKWLNEAVKSNAENTEIRYLRYSIEKNLPTFLGFELHLESDQSFIVKQLLNKSHGLDKKMFNLVRDYMVKKAKLTSETKMQLKNAKP